MIDEPIRVETTRFMWLLTANSLTLPIFLTLPAAQQGALSVRFGLNAQTAISAIEQLHVLIKAHIAQELRDAPDSGGGHGAN